MKWHASVERLAAKYCDEAQVREALHRRAFYWFKRTLSCFQIPIIILSAASGSIQFLSQSYPDIEDQIITGTATISIIVSIVTAVMTYLKLGEQKSKHEIAQIAWQSFHNTVAHQLHLSRELREDPVDFLVHIKNTYERLFEISPMISQQFVKTVKNRVNKSASNAFQTPFYLNGFHHTKIWKHDLDSNLEEDFSDNSFKDDISGEIEEKV